MTRSTAKCYNDNMDKVFNEAKKNNAKYRPHHLSQLIFTHDELYDAWCDESRIEVLGEWYRVGKMNYRQYFLEPGIPRGERYGFNEGTLWLTRTITGDNYVIGQEEYNDLPH